jgi:putative transposase
VAIGIDWEGRRQMLGVEMANRESSTSWRDFLLALKARGLRGVIFAVMWRSFRSKRAIMEVLPESYWQRCYVHFLRNALDYLPRKVADDCLVELRWLYDRRNAEEARRDLVAWLLRWQEKYPKLCAWVEDNIEQTLTFYRLPETIISTWKVPTCHEDWIEGPRYLNMETLREQRKELQLLEAA